MPNILANTTPLAPVDILTSYIFSHFHTGDPDARRRLRFSRPAPAFELYVVNDRFPLNHVPEISLKQRLNEVESFVITLEKMPSRAKDQERVWRVELVETNLINLGLRADAFLHELAITDPASNFKRAPADAVNPDRPPYNFQPPEISSMGSIGIHGLLASGPASEIFSLFSRLKTDL